MICNVRFVTQRLGKRQFMATLEIEEFKDRVFRPAEIADAIEAWGTIYNVERVKIGTGATFARLYVTTTDLNMTAPVLRREILAQQKVIEAKHELAQREGKL